MKKVFLLLALVVLYITSLTAQDEVQDQDRDQVRLMLVDGDMLQIRDRDQTRLQDKITLNDGTVVNPDGTYQTRDRDQLRLRDGECLDSDGVKYRNEYQYRYKVQQENKGLTQAQIQKRNQQRVHYIFVDGEMMQVRNQSQNRLENKMNLGDGVVVNPDGTYQSRDRKQLKLQDGGCINMDGKVFKNTMQQRKMILQKNKIQKKMPAKPKVQKKNKNGGI
ncbi:hypothetical protein L1I30_05675 [Gillisia sp. M10.2A]|uniref:DUF6799 domain-containing protein n=1 Tax=Gillisia lutea TaxID=2909668 RepID=A0ABS9EI70_9FLAO|nr:DUF6799 domain-containing protein [Gillisia lutea]MCF4101146.1 hypothetical protein [Gillisia lutea]